MNRTWKAALGMIVAVATAGWQTPSVRAADVKPALEMVPDNCWGYVVVPSLSGLNDNLTGIQQEIMGMPMFDALTWVTGTLGIEKGLDTKGTAVIFMMNAKEAKAKHKAGADKKEEKKEGKKEGEEDEEEDDTKPNPPVVIAVPVTSAKDFLEGFSPEKEDADGIVKITLKDEPSYAKVHDKYVLLGMNKDVLKTASANKSPVRVTSSRLKMINERSVTICVAAGKIVDAYKDEIRAMLPMITAAMGPQGDQIGKSVDELIKVARDVDWFDLSLGLDKSGFALSFVVTPKEGSDLAGKVKEVKLPSGTLLKGLPAGDFLFAMGATNAGRKADPKDIDKAMDAVLGNPQIKDAVDPEKLKAMVKQASDMFKDTTDAAIAVHAMPEGPEGILSAGIVMTCADSAKVMEGLAKLMTMIKDLPTEEEAKKAMQMITHNAGAETVGSAKVDTLVIDLKKAPEEVPEDVTKGISKVLGTDGLMVRFGAADGKHVVLGIGGGKEQFGKWLAAAKSGDTAVSKDATIVKTSEKIPTGRTFEMYFSAQNIMSAVNRIAKAVGEDAPIAKVPTIDAAVCMAASINEGASRFDIMVPMSVVKGIKSAATGAGGARHHKPAAADEDEDEGGDKSGKSKGTSKEKAKAGEKKDKDDDDK